MPSDLERLRSLLAELLAETEARAAAFWAGAGMPSGNDVEIHRTG